MRAPGIEPGHAVWKTAVLPKTLCSRTNGAPVGSRTRARPIPRVAPTVGREHRWRCWVTLLDGLLARQASGLPRPSPAGPERIELPSEVLEASLRPALGPEVLCSGVTYGFRSRLWPIHSRSGSPAPSRHQSGPSSSSRTSLSRSSGERCHRVSCRGVPRIGVEPISSP